MQTFSSVEVGETAREIEIILHFKGIIQELIEEQKEFKSITEETEASLYSSINELSGQNLELQRQSLLWSDQNGVTVLKETLENEISRQECTIKALKTKLEESEENVIFLHQEIEEISANLHEFDGNQGSSCVFCKSFKEQLLELESTRRVDLELIEALEIEVMIS